jgi:DNA-binding HxlR family transcriptional regulator
MEATTFLVQLFHHRWSVPVLARLGARGGGRVAELASSLGGSRGGVAQAIDALVVKGLLVRNPGHGHPLRPEFVLTGRGEALAGAARELMALLREWGIEEESLRKWPMPAVHALGREGGRFSELRDRLPGITDRALTDALGVLEGAALAERIVHTGRPPAVEYVPTDRSVELRPILAGLVPA